jgi:uncharacterized protein (UPF0212 family)
MKYRVVLAMNIIYEIEADSEDAAVKVAVGKTPKEVDYVEVVEVAVMPEAH